MLLWISILQSKFPGYNHNLALLKTTFFIILIMIRHILLKDLWKRDRIKLLMNKYDLNNYLLHRKKFDEVTD